MKHLNSFKIFEIRGFYQPLISISNEIIEKSKTSKNFTQTFFQKGKPYTIEIVIISDKKYRKEHGDGEAITYVYDKDAREKYFASIYLNEEKIEKSLIVHELKHVFSYIVSGPKSLDFNKKLNLIFRVIDKSSSIYFNISPHVVSIYLYMLSSEELEAYYNGFWVELQEETKDMSEKEKREHISKFLNNNIIFKKLREWNDGGFDLASFFKSEKLMNHWFEMFAARKPTKGIENWFYLLKSLIVKNNNDYTLAVKAINDRINSNCKKYYKKYMRLYTM